MSSSTIVSQKELKKRDFILHGNRWKVVFVIAAPLFFFTLFNYIYSIIDTIRCSGISKAAVDAVGALSQANSRVRAVGTALGAGGSILIAREIGKKDYERAHQYVCTVFFYAFVLGGIICAIVLPLAHPILKRRKITEESIAVGIDYFRFSVITSALRRINNVFRGVEKARGRTLLRTFLNIGVVLIKVALNARFLYGLGRKDRKFVSLSTRIANLCLALYVLVQLSIKNYLFRFSVKKIDFGKKILHRTFKISFPIFLGKFIFSFGKVTINGLASSYGNDVVGALGVSNNRGGSVTSPISSIEDSTSSIISQNRGANQTKRVVKCFFVGLTYALAIAVVGVILVTIFDTPITMFFARNAGTKEEIEEFAKHISNVFFYEKRGIITLAINSAVLGLLYGLGYTTIASRINISRVFLFRVPVFLILQASFPNRDGYQICGLSRGISNILIGILAGIVGILVLLHLKKRRKVKEENRKMLTKEEKQKVDSYLDSYLKNFKPYKNGAFCYEDGVLRNGARNRYEATKEEKFLLFVEKYYDRQIDSLGNIPAFKKENHSIDDLQSGYALLKLNHYKPKEKYKKAIEFLHTRVKERPRLENGSFQHKDRYYKQCWLDGLYRALPFYAEVSALDHEGKDRKDIRKQFSNVFTYNRGEDKRIYHAYDETKSRQWADKKTGRSPQVWLRSVGWLIRATCDVYESLDEDGHPLDKRKRKEYLKQELRFLEPAKDKDTGLLNDLPFVQDNRNYIETSGSLMVSYGYRKGSRIGRLKFQDSQEGVKRFTSIVKDYLKDGHLNHICLVSGLDNEKRDGSIDYYLSEPICQDDSKGVGPFRLAYSQYLRMPY